MRGRLDDAALLEAWRTGDRQAGALLVEIVIVIAAKADGSLSKPVEITDSFGSPAELGRLFLTDQLLAFEITSVVLLVAAVGGVILGSHSRQADADAGA